MKYEISGQPFPVLQLEMDEGEKIVCESGAMVWMSDNFEMKTNSGGINKLIGKMFSGEKLFQNTYKANSNKSTLVLGSEFMGNIIAVEVTPDYPIIAQKSAFLASTVGVDISVFFQKKVASAIFGGEGFIMQKFSGSGIVFLEIDGTQFDYNLDVGQKMIVSSGALAMCESTIDIDIQSVKNVKNVLFGGEGLFNTVITGPGKVVLQSQNLYSFSQTLSSYVVSNSN